MEFEDVVRRRRMVRHFKPDPVPRHTVEHIIELAQHAPSAGFSQGVSFVAVMDGDLRKKVAEFAGEEGYTRSGTAPMHPFISEAPVQIIICTSERIYKERYREPDKWDGTIEQMEWPTPYWHTDAGCAMMLILLAAVDAGLSGAFVGLWKKQEMRELLGIPEHFHPIGIALLGYRAQDVKSPSLKRGRRNIGDVLHFDHWPDSGG
jgi:nitroreductase